MNGMLPGPRVSGYDPSLTATGIAHPDGRMETIKTRDKEKDFRLVRIRVAIDESQAGGCELAIVEDLPKHAYAAGLTGMVQGIIRERLCIAGTPYALIPPATLKFYATGNGNASKQLMRKAARELAGIEFADDNQCDAWWAQHMGLDYLGCAPYELPALQRDKLLQVEPWDPTTIEAWPWASVA